MMVESRRTTSTDPSLLTSSIYAFSTTLSSPSFLEPLFFPPPLLLRPFPSSPSLYLPESMMSDSPDNGMGFLCVPFLLFFHDHSLPHPSLLVDSNLPRRSAPSPSLEPKVEVVAATSAAPSLALVTEEPAFLVVDSSDLSDVDEYSADACAFRPPSPPAFC